ncbi:MAG TPA: integrase [Clostridiales bacterium]|nr:integrase [Clostridiales bacterium]
MEKLKLKLTKTKNFEDFLSWCKVKNLRKPTVNSYILAWDMFNRIYDGEIEDIDQSDVNAFVLETHKRVKPTTVNQYLRHLRAIFNYFELPVKVKLLRYDYEPKVPYTKSELTKLLVKPDLKTESFLTYRNWVIVNLLLATGARANTIVNIKVEDVDLDDYFITFTTLKNRRTKRLPIPAVLVDILRECINYRNGKPDDYLFCNSYGAKSTVNDLYHTMCDFSQSRGVEKTGLHRFRHTFAKEFMLNGGGHPEPATYANTLYNRANKAVYQSVRCRYTEHD